MDRHSVFRDGPMSDVVIFHGLSWDAIVRRMLEMGLDCINYIALSWAGIVLYQCPRNGRSCLPCLTRRVHHGLEVLEVMTIIVAGFRKLPMTTNLTLLFTSLRLSKMMGSCGMPCGDLPDARCAPDTLIPIRPA